MITNGILLIFQNFLNIILLPLTVFNVVIDIASSIPFITQFLQVVAYIVPWSNILPIILIMFSMFSFRIGMALIKLIIYIIPLW